MVISSQLQIFVQSLTSRSKEEKSKFLQNWIMLSPIVVCHKFGLTEVSKNVTLNKNNFHIVAWSAFFGN